MEGNGTVISILGAGNRQNDVAAGEIIVKIWWWRLGGTLGVIGGADAGSCPSGTGASHAEID